MLVSTLPAVPGASPYTAEVPLPITTFPAGIVVSPVPPFPTAKTPVAFATGILVVATRLPDVGVPRTGLIKVGVVNVGLVFSTTEPVPVLDVTPVPPFPTANVPVAFATGMFVVAAMFPDVGLPNAGVIKLGLVIVGLLFITTDPVPVIGLLTSCFVELLNTARDAVKLETIRFAAVVVLPLNVRFASPPNEPELLY
jgi:hypothetical protein